MRKRNREAVKNKLPVEKKREKMQNLNGFRVKHATTGSHDVIFI